MSRIKFSYLILMMLVLSLMFFFVSGTIVASARAGGGSSHSSSSGHSSSSSSHRSSSKEESLFTKIINGIKDFFQLIICTILIFLLQRIYYKIRDYIKKVNHTLTMRKIPKNRKKLNYDCIKKEVEEAFYAIQNAWTERNQNLAKEYMSEELYCKHTKQTEEMKVKREKNILKNVTLIKTTPMGQKRKEINSESLWVRIQAELIDYTINEETNQLIEGSRYEETRFGEYWRFVKESDKVVVSEIRQIDEIHELDFY